MQIAHAKPWTLVQGAVHTLKDITSAHIHLEWNISFQCTG